MGNSIIFSIQTNFMLYQHFLELVHLSGGQIRSLKGNKRVRGTQTCQLLWPLMPLLLQSSWPSTPDPHHLSPGLTTVVNTYTRHPSMDLSSQLVLLGIGYDFLLWILELSYPLFLGQIFPVLYLVFVKKKSVQIQPSQHSPSVTLKRGDNIDIFSGCCPVATRVDLQYPLLASCLGY